MNGVMINFSYADIMIYSINHPWEHFQTITVSKTHLITHMYTFGIYTSQCVNQSNMIGLMVLIINLCI